MTDTDARPDSATNSFVHPSAVVEEDAEIGKGARIWRQAHIRTAAKIGEQSIIGANVFIDADVQVGRRCKIQNNALVYRGSVLEDGVFLGPGVILTNDEYPRAIRPDGNLKSGDDWSVSGVVVREGASLGAGVVVVPGVEIGAWASIGAGAVVAQDVPAHVLGVGVPCRSVGWVCYCGKRADTRCQECGWTRE